MRPAPLRQSRGGIGTGGENGEWRSAVRGPWRSRKFKGLYFTRAVRKRHATSNWVGLWRCCQTQPCESRLCNNCTRAKNCGGGGRGAVIIQAQAPKWAGPQIPFETAKRTAKACTLHVGLAYLVSKSPLVPSTSTTCPRNGPQKAPKSPRIHAIWPQTAPDHQA